MRKAPFTDHSDSRNLGAGRIRVMRRRRAPHVVWIALLLLSLAAALLLPRLALIRRYSDRIFSTQSAPSRTTAIVFGAGLRRDGTPTLVLADRVEAAASLYHQGTVQSILLSGSTRAQSYDEAEAMRTLAVQLGVDPADILLEHGPEPRRRRGEPGLRHPLRPAGDPTLHPAPLAQQEALRDRGRWRRPISHDTRRGCWFNCATPPPLVAVLDAPTQASARASGEAVALPDRGDSHGS
jgi:hypothetical protein